MGQIRKVGSEFGRWFVVVCVMMGGGDDLGSSLVRRRGGVWAAIGGVWGGEVWFGVGWVQASRWEGMGQERRAWGSLGKLGYI